MSTQTTHYKLDLRESSDIFNPLSTNANFESLDTIIWNVQQSGGVPTYTTTASANLLRLSGSPKANDTVFKFVAAGNANTWADSDGAIYNIVDISGTQKMITGGSLYVAWINSAKAMTVVAWPNVVNAQTFDGKGPAEWATTAQLDAVNQTAANATQTAQAAATVANQANTKAEEALANAGGMTMETLWTNPNTNSNFGAQTITLSKTKTGYKYLMISFRGDRLSSMGDYMDIMRVDASGYQNLSGFSSDPNGIIAAMRRYRSRTETTIEFDGGFYCDTTSRESSDQYAIPITVYGIK